MFYMSHGPKFLATLTYSNKLIVGEISDSNLQIGNL